MIIRSRFSIGMYTKNISEKYNTKAEDPFVEPDSPFELPQFNQTEDTEEDVRVGPVSVIEMPMALNAIQQSKSGDIDETNLNTNSRSIMRSNSYMRKRSQFSTKNPYRNSEQVGFRSNMKVFLAPESAERLGFDVGPPKVLIVDDNSIQRNEMKEKLKVACGWEPDTACNGLEAVNKYKEYAELNYKYTAIFMDLTMPEMDGIAATKRIRSLELTHNYSKTRIIGILSSFQKDEEQKCKDAGMSMTIAKDVTANELKDLIQGILALTALNLPIVQMNRMQREFTL
mmetsp:Transcript_13011/g.24162  ORF Transcript_13011/g.24162 Transcript_13011/m.24162 type:complete len:285 (+) Transcript_13011:331-1185(+)